MMSVSPPKSAGAAANYFASHLREGRGDAHEIEDYYAGEGDAGRWAGSGCAALGLEAGADITSAQFRALANGFDAAGTELAQNSGDPERRAGWDCTFSAPKSVSVVWAMADADTRAAIQVAQDRAVDHALKVLEDKAILARCGRDGENLERARLVAATFRHGTSREQDPQLHTHAFLMNLAVRDGGRCASLDAREVMRWQKAIGAAYRAELAAGLRELGYAIERDGDAFRIAGVGDEVEKEFSQRRQQIEARLRELGLWDAKSSENVALETRRAKSEVSREGLEQQWLARAELLGLTREAAAELRGTEPSRALELLSASEALEKLTANEAVLEERHLYQAAAEAAQGAVDGREAKRFAETMKLVAVEIADPVTGKTYYTTRELIAAERFVLQSARDRALDASHQLDAAAVDLAISHMEATRSRGGYPFELREEQRTAVHALTAQRGATAALVGDAGTGKSTALEAVRVAYEQQGFRVLGAALAGKAAAELQSGAGIDSRTIDRLLIDLENGRAQLDRKTVLVLDEAAMVDSRKMARITELARDSGAKLILAGDHKQLQPVGAGATFRHLSQAVPAARLQAIGRQRDEWARDAVREMSRGEAAQALGKYIERGLVDVQATHKAAVREAARQFLTDRAEVGLDRVQAIAATNAQVRDLNSEIREGLRKSGELAGAQAIQVRDGRDPEKSVKLELASGERIVVTKNENTINLKNGDFGTVVSVSPERITVRLDRTGEAVAFDPRAVAMRHGYAATTHRLQGSTVERAIVLGSERTSREMAYVQASRSKGETRWYFSAAKVGKLEIEAGVQPARAGTDREAMLQRLGSAVAAMGREAQKRSTLDYIERAPQPPTPAHERGGEQARQRDHRPGLER